MGRKLAIQWYEYILFGFFLVFGLLNYLVGRNRITTQLNDNHILDLHKPLDTLGFLFHPVVVYLVFWLGIIFTYKIALHLIKKRNWAILVALMMFFSPQLFGGAFIFPNVIYLNTLTLIGVYFSLLFIQVPNYVTALAIAMVFSAAYVFHILAIIPALLLILFLLLNILTRNYKLSILKPILLYTFVLLAVYTAMWFVIGHGSPWVYFKNLGLVMEGSTTEYFNIPRVTAAIPVLWLCYFLFAIISLNFVYFKHYFKFLKKKWMYTYLFCSTVLMILVHLFMRLSLADDWTSLLFVYPPLILIGAGGCYEFSVWLRKRFGERIYFLFKYSFIIVFIGQVLWSAFWMIYLFPHQNTYSNLPGEWIREWLQF